MEKLIFELACEDPTMPIKVKCKECGKQFVLKDEFAGKQGKCPSCGKPLAIPKIEKKDPESASKKKPAEEPGGKKSAPPSEDEGPAKKPEEKKPAPKAEKKPPPPSKKQPSTKPEKKAAAKKPDERVECPGCGVMVAQGAVVCIRCGTNIVTGARGATHVGGAKLVGLTRLLRTAIGLAAAAGFVAMIALVVSKALTSSKIAGIVAGDEGQVVKDLQHIAAAQKTFRRRALVDQDGNGIGEYGLLTELVNEARVRNPESKATSKDGDLSYAFATGGKEGNGTAQRRGYRFRMFLATLDKGEGDDKTLGGTPDVPGQVLDNQAAVELQEKSFICYAWPEVRYADGIHAYVIDQSDSVYFTRMKARVYEGETGPHPESAYAGGVGFGEELASGRGNDGNTWAPIPDPDTVSWKTSFVWGLLFDLNTPWFTPAAVKDTKETVDIEETCRDAVTKRDLAKQREGQENWQGAEQFYKDALGKLGKDTWPEKTLARKIEMKLAAVRRVLEAGKLEGEKKWAEAREAYTKALAGVSNTRAIQNKLAALKSMEDRLVAKGDKTAATRVQDAAKRELQARQFLGVCAKFGDLYALWATVDYYLSSPAYKGLHKDARAKKAEIDQKIKADPKAYPSLRVEKGKSFDVILLKNKKIVRGKILERTDRTLKVEVADADGKVINRLLNAAEVEKVEKKSISADALNKSEAERLYTEAVKRWIQGTYVHALAEFGRLKYYFADAALQADAAQQKKLAGPVLGGAAMPDKLSPADLVRSSVESGGREMCPICLGRKRLICRYCKGTGTRPERTKCKICDGTGKSPCSICRGTRVRQGNCGTCGTRGTIECITCKGRGKLHPYVQCTNCKGTGHTEERCPKCRGTGTDSKTRQPCDACGGSGKVYCKECKGKGNRIADYEIPCRECQGKGRIACPNCGGTGKAPVNIRCPRCKGKGKFQCPKCKGVGRYEGKPCPLCKGARDIPCAACKGVGKPICRACNGSGKETCKTCRGTGKVKVKCKYCDKNHTISCGHCKGTGKRIVK